MASREPEAEDEAADAEDTGSPEGRPRVPRDDVPGAALVADGVEGQACGRNREPPMSETVSPQALAMACRVSLSSSAETASQKAL